LPWWRALAITSSGVLPESRHPARDEAVFAAWTRLGAFRGWDLASFADALYLLIETPSVEGIVSSSMPACEPDPRSLLRNGWCVPRLPSSAAVRCVAFVPPPP